MDESAEFRVQIQPNATNMIARSLPRLRKSSWDRRVEPPSEVATASSHAVNARSARSLRVEGSSVDGPPRDP